MERVPPDPNPPPEPAAAGPHRAASPPPHRTPVSWLLLAANVAIFVWIATRASTTDTETLVRYGALHRGRVWSGEWWRLLSAAFLHVGPFHLVANMVFGIPWCRQLERGFGSARFATLYLASALGGSAFSLLGPATVSAGASGALFGVIGASLAVHRRGLGSLRAFLANRGSKQVLLNLAALAVAGVFLPIDQLAHAGGFVTGAAWGWIATRPWPRRPWPWIAFAATLAAVVALALRPSPDYVRARADLAALDDVFALLKEGEVGEARARVDGIRARGVAPTLSDHVEYVDAAVLVAEGQREPALVILRHLADADSPIASDAQRARARVAREAGRQLLGGEPPDRDRGLAYLDEACTAGDREACAAATAERSGPAR